MSISRMRRCSSSSAVSLLGSRRLSSHTPIDPTRDTDTDRDTDRDRDRDRVSSFSIAPMMDYTNKHQRSLMRLITKRSVLYTEMVVCNALIRRDDKERSLHADFDVEDPLVLQLGGSDPKQMEEASKIAFDYGYRAFNINVGCPSQKVSGAGCFGAVLMKDPHLVSDLCQAISNTTGCSPSVKCRIGIDNDDQYEYVASFVDTVMRNGSVNEFIIHARKAILGVKMTPADNRKIPPLKYDYVYRLVKDFPTAEFTINGGITSYDEMSDHIKSGVHGVMVGRGVVASPYYYRHVDSWLDGNVINFENGEKNTKGEGFTRRQIVDAYAEYADRSEKSGEVCNRALLLKPLHNLFNGAKNARVYRRMLSEYTIDRTLCIKDVILKSCSVISDDDMDYY